MAKGGLVPEKIDVARLNGFQIYLCPHACIQRSDEHSIYGILVQATHEELNKLYTMPGVGVFLPQAVLVETCDGKLQPTLCYIPPTRGDKPADQEYLEHLVKVARQYDFPEWYVRRLESFRLPAKN